jgi:hypothetical protein
MRQRWYEQQQINLAIVANPELIKLSETVA